MASSVRFLDILVALEPTGFSEQNPSLVLGLVATTFIVSMASLFIYAYNDRVKQVANRSKELQKLVDSLESPSNDTVRSTEVWDGSIAPNILKIDWLGPSWKAYREQCWEHDGNIASLADADVYFADIQPAAKGFTEQIAGILTSVGILGTFVGITVGLGQIGADMGGGSSENMQHAMSSLISSLGVSFRTSIWGLIASMAITAMSNAQASNLETQRQRLVSWINANMPQKRDTALLAEQTALVEKQMHATEQTQQVLKIGFKALQASMENVGKIIAENQQKGLDTLVEQFMKQMKDSMNADFSSLGTALQEMVSSNERFQHSMSQLVTHLQSATQNQGTSAQQMQDAIANAAKSIAAMQGSFSSLSSVSSDIQTAAMAMQKILEKQMNASNSQQETISNMMNGMNNQANSMVTHQEEISKASAVIAEKFSSLGDALESLIAWHSRVKDGLEQQIAALNQTVEAQKVVADKMSEERRAALDIVQHLASTQANLGPAATAIASAGDAVKKASDSLFSTEKSLRQLSTTIQDNSRELTDRHVQSLDRYNEIRAALQTLLTKR